MGMRTVNDPYGDPGVLVDTVFGSSYDAVRSVANNIDYVKKVANLFDTSDTIVSNLHQRYVSVGGQNQFELPVAVVSEAFVTVFVNGKWQSPSVTYTAYETTLFFNQALAQGDVVDVMIVSSETFDVLQKLKEDAEDTITGIGANVRKTNFDATRAPLPTDDETQGYAAGSRWLWQWQEWVYAGAGLWVAKDRSVTPEMFAAVGNGIADDQPAWQAALASGLPVKGRKGAIYRLGSPLVVPSGARIDMAGSSFRRGFSGTWAIRNATAATTHSDKDIHLSNLAIDDDGTSATRGPFLLMSGVKGLQINGFKATGKAPNEPGGSLGGWGAYISGEDITIGDVEIDTSECGLYGDGLHFGWLNGMSLSNFVIRAGDDALAFHFVPSAWGIVGLNAPARGINVSGGYVSSSHANGIRLGAWPDSGANSVWQDVSISDVTFGPCATSCVQLYDNRPPASIVGVNDNIRIENLNFGDQTCTRLINILGNPDITNAANRTQKNFRNVTIEGVSGKNAGQLVRAGGVLNLTLSDYVFSTSALTAVPPFEMRQITALDCADGRATVNTTSPIILIDRVEFFRGSDLSLLAFTSTSPAAYQINLNADVATAFRLFDGLIRGTITTGIVQALSGTLSTFVVQGTDIWASDAQTTIKNATARYSFRPAFDTGYLVANLPTSGQPGVIVWASNGRRSGEAAGAGTGVPVYFNNGKWRTLYDNSVVQE